MENDKSYEPMDIDLSSHSVSAMDISYTDTKYIPNISNCSNNFETERNEDIISENCLNLKPLNINDLIEKKTKNRNQTKTCKRLFKCLSYILILILSIITYQVANFRCSENVNISLLKDVLVSRLYGQTIPTKSLLKALESEAPRKIIILYGGTGVGKTYISSIILESLLTYGNIYHYTMPGFLQTSTDFMFGLIFCKSTMIVVDDLQENDILKIEDSIKDLVNKSERNSNNVTIILLYNIEIIDEKFQRKHDNNFVLKLKQSLESISVQKHYIKLNTLTEDDLKRCIQNEFPNKKFSESAMHSIMKNFNVTIDGCKGVYQKMKYLSIV